MPALCGDRESFPRRGRILIVERGTIVRGDIKLVAVVIVVDVRCGACRVASVAVAVGVPAVVVGVGGKPP